MRVAILVVLLAAHVAAAHRAASAWTSDVALWRQAIAVAPFKPRPRLNYATALLAAGRLAEALEQTRIADRLLQQPRVSEHERLLSAEIVRSNMLLLSYAGIATKGTQP